MATNELEERLKKAEEQRTSLESVQLSVPDWRKLNVDQPFYNSISKEYCIPVATDIEYIDEGVIEDPEIAGLAKRQGIQNLWRLFNKDDLIFRGAQDPWDFASIANLLDSTRIDDYHMDARPCSRLRYLVCIPGPLFETFPENPPAYLSNTPSGDVKHIAIYTISELRGLLDSVASSLEDHVDRVDKYFADGATRPPDLDLYREAARLRSVYASVIKMLRSNGYSSTDDRFLTIQFGFGPEKGESEGLTIVGCPDPFLPLINVGLRKTSASTLAEKAQLGYYTFKDNPPIKYARTRRYLSRLRELKDEFECPDSVGIWGVMGMSRETYENISEFAVGSVEVWDQFSNSRRGRQIIDEIEDKWPFDEDKKIKTADEVREEKKAIDSEKKRKQADENEEGFDFVGGLLLSAEGQKKLREELYDAAAAYDKLLNNVDIKYIAGIALRALTHETFADDINRKIFEWSMAQLDRDALWGIAKECVPLETLAASGLDPDQINNPPQPPATPDECTVATVVPLVVSPVDQAASAAASTVTALLLDGQGDEECLKGAIEKYCPAPARMFGMKGHVENFLHRQTSNLVTWDRENLCPDPDDTKGTPWKVPTINFPSYGADEVVDISKGILNAFKKALEDTRDELVLGIVNELLQILYDNVENILCNWSDMKKFGSETIPALWSDPAGELDAAATGLWEDVAVERFKDALIDWGVPKSELYPANPDVVQEGGVTYDQRIKDFMEDVSACLNPGELRASLRGRELGQNFEVIERAAAQHLPCIDAADALSVLAHASRNMDFQALSDRTRRKVGRYICDDTNAKAAEEEFKKAFAGRASEAVVKELWNKQKQKTLSTVGSLIGVMDTPYDKMLCGADRNYKTTQALASVRNSDSQQYMNKAALDAIWSPILSAYNREIQSWPLALIEGKERRSTKGDPDYEIEISRIMAEETVGAAVRRPPTRAEAEDMLNKRISEGSITPGRQVVAAVLPRLQDALKQDKTFEAILNRVGSSISFSWPTFGAPAPSPTTAEELSSINAPGLTYRYHPVYGTSAPTREMFWEKKYTLLTHADGLPPVNNMYRALTPNTIEYLENDPARSMFIYEGANPEVRSSGQIMFANYMTVRQAIEANDAIRNDESFSHAASGIYIDAQDKLIEQVGNMFAESPLWQTTDENNQGILDITLDRGAPSNATCPAGATPKDNLLRTNYEKDQISKISERLQEQMVFEVDSVRRSAISDASVPAILRSLIRIHVVELVLRSIFGMVSFGSSRSQSSIFKKGILSEFASKMVMEGLRDFMDENRQAFADLGDSDDLMANLEQQLSIAGIEDLNGLIADEMTAAFQILGNVIEDEFPGMETNVLQRIGRGIPFTEVPEASVFRGRPGTTTPGPWWFSPPETTPFLADPYPWKLKTFNSPWSDGFNVPLGPGPFLSSDDSTPFNWNHDYRGLERTVHDPGARWDSDRVFVQSGSSLALNSSPKRDFYITTPHRQDRRPPNIDSEFYTTTWGVHNDFSFLSEPGYFVFERFIRLKTTQFDVESAMASEGDVIHNAGGDPVIYDPDNPAHRQPGHPLRPGVPPDRRNPAWWVKKRIINFLQQYDGRVQNKEAFRIAFREAVLTLQNDWWTDVRNPSDPVEEQFFDKQALAVNQFREGSAGRSGAPLSTHFGNWKLEEFLDSFEYGVRLSYMSTSLDNFPGAESVTLTTNAVSSSAGLEEETMGVKIIPLFEEVEALPIGGDNALTVANFYGAEGKYWNSAVGAPTPPADRPGGPWPPPPRPHGAHYHSTFRWVEEIDGSTVMRSTPRQNWKRNYGGLWNREIFTTSFETLRARLIESEDFKILFDFALGATDLVSLFAIYCMYSSQKLKPSIDYAFYGTKMSLVGALYANQPHLPVETFFKKQDPLLNSVGGPAGLHKNQQGGTSTSGQAGNAAAKTVPYLVKGLAQYQDPSYSLATQLDKLSLLPNGLNQSALAFLAPSNIVPGSMLPPVTPLGITAYTFGKLPGEKVPYDDRSAAAQGRLAADGESADAAEQCEPAEEDTPRRRGWGDPFGFGSGDVREATPGFGDVIEGAFSAIEEEE